MTEHTHNHDHEQEFITLVDDQGNETLFEILLTIDGQEEFGKNYVLVVPAGAEEDEESHAGRARRGHLCVEDRRVQVGDGQGLPQHRLAQGAIAILFREH